MNQRLLISIISAAVIIMAAMADNTTRGKLQRLPEVPAFPSANSNDTIPALGDEIAISGYDKPLNSRTETFHASSTLPDTIVAVDLTMVYTDKSGRQLHSVRRTIGCTIPPYGTRLISVPSWDPQCRYFYGRGKQPRSKGVTPFWVNVTVHSIVIKR